MSRMYIQWLFLAAVSLGVLSGGDLAGNGASKPVYVYLYARVTDHVNIAMTEDRLRHILPLIERYRQMRPESQVSATVLFSGAASRALEERNSQTHIVDFVKDYIHRNVIEAGYDGTDEPTYEHRPTLEWTGREPPRERWKMRQSVAEQFLSETRDLNGALSPGAGGLKEMQAVFGPAACIQGVELALKTTRPPQKVVTKAGQPPSTPTLPVTAVFRENGGDTETLFALRPYNAMALMTGIAAANPAQFPGFGGASTRFGQLMAPIPEAAPEIFWQDYTLRMSEANGPIRPVKADDGVERLKGVLEKAPRQTIQAVRVEIGSADKYLKPDFAKTAPNAPLKYAYDHPAGPQLPSDDLRPPADVEAAWVKEDQVMQWLAEVYLPANRGSRFVSNADLLKMAGRPTGFDIETEDLRSALKEVLAKWSPTDTYTFSYLRVNRRYLSLAELFQVLVDELAGLHTNGKLPQTVKAVKVYGPIRLVTGHGPNIGEVTVGELAGVCAELAGPLHDDSSTSVPKNAIPPLLKVKGMDLNPAQFLRLMAQAVMNPAPGSTLRVRMTYMLGEAGGIFPKSRELGDSGFVWTIKPAPLNTAVSN